MRPIRSISAAGSWLARVCLLAALCLPAAVGSVYANPVTRFIDPWGEETPEPKAPPPVDPHATPTLGGPPVRREEYDANHRLRAAWHVILDENREQLRHGGFVRYHDNGRMEVTGRYRRGAPVGLWRWYDTQGVLLREVYHHGDYEEVTKGRDLQRPETVIRAPNGRVQAEGLYKDGQPHGRWVFYHPGGGPKAEGEYLTGVPEGRWNRYFPNGQVERVENYRLGVLHGEYREGYENGQEKIRGSYDQGQPVGEWRTWFRNGQMESAGRFADGRREGEWRVHGQDGALLRREFWVAGRMAQELPLAKARAAADPVIPADAVLPAQPRLFDEAGQPIQGQANY